MATITTVNKDVLARSIAQRRMDQRFPDQEWLVADPKDNMKNNVSERFIEAYQHYYSEAIGLIELARVG